MLPEHPAHAMAAPRPSRKRPIRDEEGSLRLRPDRCCGAVPHPRAEQGAPLPGALRGCIADPGHQAADAAFVQFQRPGSIGQRHGAQPCLRPVKRRSPVLRHPARHLQRRGIAPPHDPAQPRPPGQGGTFRLRGQPPKGPADRQGRRLFPHHNRIARRLPFPKTGQTARLPPHRPDGLLRGRGRLQPLGRVRPICRRAIAQRLPCNAGHGRRDTHHPRAMPPRHRTPGTIGCHTPRKDAGGFPGRQGISAGRRPRMFLCFPYRARR